MQPRIRLLTSLARRQPPSLRAVSRAARPTSLTRPLAVGPPCHPSSTVACRYFAAGSDEGTSGSGEAKKDVAKEDVAKEDVPKKDVPKKDVPKETLEFQAETRQVRESHADRLTAR